LANQHGKSFTGSQTDACYLARDYAASPQAISSTAKRRSAAEGEGEKAVADNLAEALRKGSVSDVSDAVAALDLLSPENAASALASALSVTEPAVRVQVVQALGRLGTVDAIRTVAQVLYGDSDARVRKQAMEVLAEQPHEIAHLFVENATAVAGRRDSDSQRVRCVAE
jgi:HEAT repeat protein